MECGKPKKKRFPKIIINGYLYIYIYLYINHPQIRLVMTAMIYLTPVASPNGPVVASSPFLLKPISSPGPLSMSFLFWTNSYYHK